MPIFVDDFTWNQNEQKLFVVVPLNGVKACEAHVLIAEVYVRIDYTPYIFEIFLNQPIQADKGVCVFSETEAYLELDKQNFGYWNCLQREVVYPDEKVEIRIQAVNEARLREKTAVVNPMTQH